MSDKNQEAPLTGHEYDGILERDNPLPGWWLSTFFATIIFSFMYYMHYQIANVGLTLQDELKIEMQKIEKASAAAEATGSVQSEEQLTQAMAATGILEKGKQVFLAKCSACHGQNGEGVIGPNLTDHFWIHGKGQRSGILAVVEKGVLEKGMPAWKGVLPDDEVLSVTAYIFQLKDTHPLNAKAPQGEEIQ